MFQVDPDPRLSLWKSAAAARRPSLPAHHIDERMMVPRNAITNVLTDAVCLAMANRV